MCSEPIAQEAKGRMGYWRRVLLAMRARGIIIIIILVKFNKLVKKILRQNIFHQLKRDKMWSSQRFWLLVGYNI